MSGALNFFKNAGIAKLGNIGDSMVSWYAQHDPETASAADIAELGQRAAQLAHRIAEKQGELEHDQKLVGEYTEKLNRDRQAASILGDRLKAAQAEDDALKVTQITAQLMPVLADMEQLAGEDGTATVSGKLFDARAELAADTDDMVQFREAHTRAINDWTGADTRLKQARSSMEHATEQKRMAEERQHDAERDANLLRGGRSGHVALDAMEQRAAKLKIDAQAAQIQANALKHQQGSDVADIVNQTLAGTQPDKGNTALDRLARLTGGKS